MGVAGGGVREGQSSARLSVLLSYPVLPYTNPTLSCLIVPALMTQRPEIDPERPLNSRFRLGSLAPKLFTAGP